MAETSQIKPRPERHRHRDRRATEGDVFSSRSKGKERAVDFNGDVTLVDGAKAGKKRRKRQARNGLPSLPIDDSVEGRGESSTSRAPRRREDSEQWDHIPVAQNEFTRVPPVWSKDGRFYFSVVHTSIHIHSSTLPNFSRLSTLSSTHPKGHFKPITSLQLSPINPFQIVTSSLDGTIKIWDWVAGRLIRTIDFHEPQSKVDHVAFGQVVGKWWLFAAVTHVKQSSSAGQKLAHRLLRTPLGGNSSPVLLGKLSNRPVSLIMSPRSTYLVALAANKAYTYRMPAPPFKSSDPWEDRPTCVKFVSDQPFTCGAFCPEKTLATATEEEWFATGDQKGVIRLWHGLTQAFRQVDAAASLALGGVVDSSQGPETEKRLPTTSLHWHAHAVSAIAFTPSGSQLLSVGEESVLVQWHLASGRREYIPRLGGRPIVSLAVRKATAAGEEEWWMALADGSVVRVGASSNRVANVGQGIRLDPLRPSSPDTPYPLSVHPSTGSLVVPSSHPSTIQFIDPIASTVLFDLEVVPSNRVSRREEKELEPVKVEKVAFSEEQDGKSMWMATMEGREGDEGEGGGMVKNLKMWKWMDDRYLVNTQFPRPHGTSDISSVIFSPTPSVPGASSHSVSAPNPYLLTTSNDGVARIWRVRQSRKSEQGKVSAKKPIIVELYWSCRSTFNYRNLPIRASAFSPDASILALSHGSVVSLWDVSSNILLKVLDSGLTSDIMTIGFIGKEGRWLVGTGKGSGVAVWDLLSCEVVWSSPSLAADSLITSSTSPYFISASNASSSTTLRVFAPDSPTPLRTISVDTKVTQIVSLSQSSASDSSSSLHLIGIAPSGEIYRFGDIAAAVASESAKSVRQAQAKEGLSIWQEMFGKGAFLEEPEAEESTTATASALQQRVSDKSGRPADIFEGPSHTMPSTGLLFDAFMDELLQGNTAAKEEEKVKEVTRDEAVVYEMEVDKSGAEEMTAGEIKGRAVGDGEIRELEAFFKDLLSSVPRAPLTPASRKPDPFRIGLSSHLTNHTPARSVATPLQNRKANGDASRGRASLLAGGNHVDESDIGTPGSVTASGNKKGKKRKAPREE
ncbi:NET1-associated nuclear protein 1 (U3 small nucleolar RNA-associated protein 17) [Cryptococcus neoformans Tu401-1]|nr:NET1-associated nuclear protein 1 (U3 small nucleolar RNA-associated protein 17) [Cryptococcus neoformans var. grubii Bt85]OXG22124.1 NET1-associated nuclear protein 1 (U3 small nucleolar RNA-associated protein 17) [Cryptococcus neoformans var. grubii Tu401-1]OXM81162.1 NET1-associated nuclear protein 1 (U3 small nucleolar RNA-associated protein 17) [Cryptococcus neoformans var. grubii Bt63]